MGSRGAFRDWDRSFGSDAISRSDFCSRGGNEEVGRASTRVDVVQGGGSCAISVKRLAEQEERESR